MPKPRKPRTALQATAAAQDDAKKQGKARKLLSSLVALIGGKTDAAAPNAKMRKVTEKHTKVRLEEEEGYEEEEESDAGSESTEDGESTGGSEAEEEEEESDAGSAEEEEEEEEEASEEEEEEEEARASNRARPSASVLSSKQIKAAHRAADAAFLAAIPEPLRGAAALRSPSRVARYAKKATGAKSLDDALGALSAMPVRSAATAKLEAKVDRIEATTKRDRINVIIAEAKAEGRAGATSREGRDSMRALGAQMGPRFLRGHVATLPIAARTNARLPNSDAPGGSGAPSNEDQARMREQAMSGLDAKGRALFLAIESEKRKANGAAKREEV